MNVTQLVTLISKLPVTRILVSFGFPNNKKCGLAARVTHSQIAIDVYEGHMWPVVIYGDVAILVAQSWLKASRERSTKQQ